MAFMPAICSLKSTLSMASSVVVLYWPIVVSYCGTSDVLDDLVQVAAIPVTVTRRPCQYISQFGAHQRPLQL